ncbi:uncharacterized protein LOC132612251 [Lycium barbarum]|uniref:uncharacterized protein LOC132612251 n=1 Tax=Lycium barbarum TaxID=112863 RepID=UPI00293EC032|nr:uncharacterized protein LOC132612251 [Lycium barbarum]
MDRAKEAIEKGFNGNRKQYEKVGHVLNPRIFYTNYQNKTLSGEVWDGYLDCVAKMVPDVQTQDAPVKELHIYKYAIGSFAEWWSVFGNHTPNLQQFAIKIHTKKRNRLELSRLNNLLYIKYNRTLKRHYDVGDTIDPIQLDNIDEANEWLIGCPENEKEQLVYEGCDLDWGTVYRVSGVEENIYGLRGVSSSSRSHNKGKGLSTTTSLSRSRCLIDENSEPEEEEDEEQYTIENFGYQEFANLEDLEFE